MAASGRVAQEGRFLLQAQRQERRVGEHPAQQRAHRLGSGQGPHEGGQFRVVLKVGGFVPAGQPNLDAGGIGNTGEETWIEGKTHLVRPQMLWLLHTAEYGIKGQAGMERAKSGSRRR